MLTISFVSKCRLWKASVLDDCFAQFSSKYVLKKERRQAVLGLLEQKPDWCVAVLSTSFGKFLIYQLFTAVKLKQREKNVVLVASPLRMLSMIKLKQCFFKTILYQKINYSLNCNYQLSTLCRVICFLLHLPLVFL